eukprot:scaffold2945_cov244-Pinguiococcus_pyrenoidosus.AAC.1
MLAGLSGVGDCSREALALAGVPGARRSTSATVKGDARSGFGDLGKLGRVGDLGAAGCAVGIGRVPQGPITSSEHFGDGSAGDSCELPGAWCLQHAVGSPCTVSPYTSSRSKSTGVLSRLKSNSMTLFSCGLCRGLLRTGRPAYILGTPHAAVPLSSRHSRAPKHLCGAFSATGPPCTAMAQVDVFTCQCSPPIGGG